MPRIAGMIVKGEDMVYHVISRTALDGFLQQTPQQEKDSSDPTGSKVSS